MVEKTQQFHHIIENQAQIKVKRNTISHLVDWQFLKFEYPKRWHECGEPLTFQYNLAKSGVCIQYNVEVPPDM